jgi:hypothetical protein
MITVFKGWGSGDADRYRLQQIWGSYRRDNFEGSLMKMRLFRTVGLTLAVLGILSILGLTGSLNGDASVIEQRGVLFSIVMVNTVILTALIALFGVQSLLGEFTKSDKESEYWQLVLRTANREDIAQEALTALGYQANELLMLFEREILWQQRIAGQSAEKADQLRLTLQPFFTSVKSKKDSFWAAHLDTAALLAELQVDDVPVELPDSVRGCCKMNISAILDAHQWQTENEQTVESDDADLEQGVSQSERGPVKKTDNLIWSCSILTRAGARQRFRPKFFEIHLE